jgi:tripartite-type tricarboxylate transporter receptor subunit TctC
VLPLVQAGRLRALAITSRDPSPMVPGVPGMAQAGLPDYEISFWYGVFVPAGTPAEATRRLFQATVKAVQAPETGRAFAREGTEAVASSSPEEFAAFITEDAKLWTRIVRDSGAKVD